jgi:hypothetical protein
VFGLVLALPVLLFGAFLALVALVFWWSLRHRRERSAMWTALATELPMDLVLGRSVPLGEAARAALLERHRVHGPKALLGRPHLACRQPSGATLRAGDTAQFGEGADELTLIQWEDPRWTLPLLAVRPRSPLASPFASPIEAFGDPEFDRTFEVFAPDAEAVRAVLGPELRSVLVTQGARWFWECCETSVAVSDGGLASVAEIRALIAGLSVVAGSLRQS